MKQASTTVSEQNRNELKTPQFFVFKYRCSKEQENLGACIFDLDIRWRQIFSFTLQFASLFWEISPCACLVGERLDTMVVLQF
jgi:hypothetical protein